MGEIPGQTPPAEPSNPGGGAPSPGQQQRYEPFAGQPFSQQPPMPPGQPFGPTTQQPTGHWTQGPQYAGPPAAAHPPATSPEAQDRLPVHLIWEGILLVLAVILVVAGLATASGAHLSEIIGPVGYIGFVAAGLALSLRTASPNLAVGSIATVAGVIGAHLATADGWSLWPAMILAVVVSGVIGLIAGVVAAALSVPAWAVTLGVAVLADSVALGIAGNTGIVLHNGSYPTALWVVMFVLVSVGGSALWLVPGVRARLSAGRDAAEPARWTGLPAGIGAVVGLTGSSLLAGIGGASMATYAQDADPAVGGLNLTLLALAAVLLGGVSVFGRRGGLAGTALGVLIVSAVQFLLAAHNIFADWQFVPIGVLVLLGLGVSRGVESITDSLNQTHALNAAPPAGLAPPSFAPPGSAP